MNLGSKLSLGVISIVSFSVLGVSGLTIYSQRQLLIHEISEKHKQLTQQLAGACEESLYQSNIVFFNFVKTLEGERGFVSAFFVDKTGNIQFHSNPSLIDTHYTTPERMQKISSENGPETYKYLEKTHNAIVGFRVAVQFAGKQVGWAHLLISKRAIQQFLNASLVKDLQRIGLITLLILLLSLIITVAFSKTMVTPIQKVVQGMRRISKGQLEPISLPKRHDEIGWMGNELNITIDKLKELEELKRDFVAGITHDLKSPLKSIQGFVSILLNELEKLPLEDQRDYLLTIQNDSSRLMKLIEDLLITSRIEAKREEFDRTIFDVRSTIDETRKRFMPISKEKKVDLKLDLPNRPAYVWADREKLIHILNNLTSNAFKFTEKGSVTIAVKGNENATVVRVADTGRGIPTVDRDKIFEKFYRSKSTAKDTKGSGLGLFIVKGLVEAQGGKITVTANHGGGTQFTFSLPKEET